MINEKFDQIDVVIMLSTYNGEKYLNDQMQSIANQDFIGNIVLMIRDDGSTDRTLSIINYWKTKINIIFIDDKEKLGPAMSFWKLMKFVPQAKFYAFVDQDDVWHTSKLTTGLKKLGDNPGKTLWFSNCRLISHDGTLISESMNNIEPVMSVSSELVCGFAQGCSMIFTHELLKFCLSYEWSYIPMHDILIISCAFMCGKVIYEHKPFFDYRLHMDNVTTKNEKKFIGRLSTTYRIWFKEKNKISMFAKDLCKINNTNISIREKEYLFEVSKIKKSFKSRIYVLRSQYTKTNNPKGLRSFKIRTFLGLI